MKKLLLIPITLFIGLFIISCEDSTTGPGEVTTGILSVQSIPVGAQIWVDGTNTGKITPDSIKNLSAGNHALTLKFDGYKDTIQASVSITAGQTTSRNITLSRAASTFGSIKIWETQGTDPITQPSGLDLSSGTAYGISSADNGKVDIYYSSSGFVVRSANAATGLTRVTSFFVGSGTNLNDGVASPLATGSWASQMGDREDNYVFLFDNDQHYSKLKITDWRGGNPGDPAWVEVQFIYNEQANSKVF